MNNGGAWFECHKNQKDRLNTSSNFYLQAILSAIALRKLLSYSHLSCYYAEVRILAKVLV